MPRPAKESKLDSKDARARLKPRAQPYLRALEEGFALCYRRNLKTGAWSIRFVEGDDYRIEPLGKADDFAPSDGETILTYAEAFAKAGERVKAIKGRALPNGGKPPTVADAVEAYLKLRESREIARRGTDGLRSDARSRLTKHVLVAAPDLAAKPLHELTAEHLKTWRAGRSKLLADVKRLINDFRAALNEAASTYRKQAPGLAEEIREGFKSSEAKSATAREHQILTDADVRAILAAAAKVDARGRWDGALVRLVAVLAATGARFSQIVRMRVADVQPSRNRLMVPVSAKGRGVKQRPQIAVQVGEDVLEMLRPAALDPPALDTRIGRRLERGRPRALAFCFGTLAALGGDHRRGRPSF